MCISKKIGSFNKVLKIVREINQTSFQSGSLPPESGELACLNNDNKLAILNNNNNNKIITVVIILIIIVIVTISHV